MNNTVAELLLKYKNGNITFSEWQELRAAVLSGEYREPVQADILSELQKGAPAAGWNEADANAILHTILSTAPAGETAGPLHRVHFLRRAWTRYAAAVIILLGTAGYGWYRIHQRTREDIVVQPPPATIRAAKNGAILTLADGSNVALDSAANRQIAAQNGTRVLLKNGQLVYAPGTVTAGETVYNTITTTKGNQFNIVLPDGTKVYLNAASSLHYPTVFAGRERRISISGEAWFEVAKDADRPFRVSIDQQTEVEVLGTSFNVNAYKDESSIDATLVEGLIRVIKGEERMIVKPGEQARVSSDISLIKNADVDKALAWKNGIFNFEGVGLREMMRQLERWYNIEVVYAPNVQDVKFFGKISRKVDLTTVLEALKGFGLHYEMKADRKLTVMP